MPDLSPAIGATAHIYVPDDTEQIALGYTHIRIYWASSETAAATLATSIELVSGQKDYSYNKTDALITDWFEYALYGATPGEGPRSERVPVGPPRTTRKEIRRAVGQRLRLMTLATVLGDPAPTTTTFASENLIDADASKLRFANWFARASNATRRVRSAENDGYTPATGVIKVNAFASAPNQGDEIELWRPKGDDDPSALIDEAMNRARFRLWWEDTFYFTADENVAAYWMPPVISEHAIKKVEFAAYQYPSHSRWSPVAGVWTTRDGGSLMLEIEGEWAPYSAGTVLRVVYNRHGDRMDDDADSWDVPLEWAVAETALAFLNVMGPSGGLESVIDVNRAKSDLSADITELRRRYMPSTAVRQEIPR